MMTHKKLLSEIVTQSKDNTQQLNDELKEQVRIQYNEANQQLLDAFSQCYNKALFDFSAHTAEIQKQQYSEILDVVYKLIDNTIEHKKDTEQLVVNSIASLREEQHTILKEIQEVVKDIAETIKVQSKSIDELKKQSENTNKFLMDSVSEIKEAVKTNVNTLKSYSTESLKNITEIKSLINSFTEKQLAADEVLNKTLNNSLENGLSNISAGISVELDKQNKTNEAVASFNANTFSNFSKTSEQGITEIKFALDTFFDEQKKTNKELCKVITRSLDDGTDKMADKLKVEFERHQSEIKSIDKKILAITENYESQLNKISDIIQKNQELSSNDIKILEKIIKK